MIRFSWSLVLAFLILTAAPVDAAKRAMSVDDVLALERLDRVTLSPDGELVAAVILRPAQPGEVYGRTDYEIDTSRADVWVINRKTRASRNLTQGKMLAAGAWCATWSPDGDYLAYLSTRPEGAEPHGGDNVRIYVWDRRSGRSRRLSDRAVLTQTRYGGAIHKLDLAGPGSSKPDACADGDENPPFVWLDATNLLVAALPRGQVSGLLDVTERVDRQVAAARTVLRAGLRASFSASGSGAERTSGMSADERAILAVANVRSGDWREVASVPAYPFNGSLGVRVSPDGRRAAVLATVAAIAPQMGTLFVRNDGDWMVEKQLGLLNLTHKSDIKWISLPARARLPVSLEGWEKDGRAITLVARASPDDKSVTRYRVEAQTTDTSSLTVATESPAQVRPAWLPQSAEIVSSGADGPIWKEQTPSGIFLRTSKPDGSERRDLLALNRHIASIDLGRTLQFEYAGANGTPLRAGVLLPPNYRDGQKIPVIVWVYGGATNPGADDYFFNPYMPGIYNLRLYAAKGYAVMIPSIPLKRDGSQDHLTALAPAVLPAIDKLVTLGIADPDRVGVMGQSYGGYTALGLATQTNRFRAVVAIAPISDLTAYYGAFDPTARGYAGIDHEKSSNIAIAEVGTAALQGPPYSEQDRYRRNSPLTFVSQVRAPVLLIHGERDIRGSMYQSEALFTGLWRQGKTSRILRYWGEDHTLGTSPATVRSVADEITRWFDRYLDRK